MENDILDSLNDLKYEGPLSDEAAFIKAIEGGVKSLEFTKLIHIIAEEIKRLCNLEETVNMMDDPDESTSFLLELSSFLKELKCPYKQLVTGHMSSRLQTKDDRLLLLDYMISELMAARMVNVDCPKETQAPGMEIVMQESPTAKNLKEILIALKFNKPPPNITPEMLFAKLETKLKDTIQKEGDQLVGKPLYNKAITEKDWKQLEDTFTEMFEEYRLRRETLITRLECTIQSFEWSDRLKTKKDLIQSTYRPKRENLKVKPDVKLSDFLAARTSLLHVEKTSSASVRKNTQTDVNKVLIGQVPDRGGRPHEQQPPPPEMPSWQQRTAAGGGRGGRGGGGGGGGGGGFNNSNSAGAADMSGEGEAAGTRGVGEVDMRGEAEGAGEEEDAADECRAAIVRVAGTMVEVEIITVGEGTTVGVGTMAEAGSMAGLNITEITKHMRSPPVATTTRVRPPSARGIRCTIRTLTNTVTSTRGTVEGTTRAGMIVWEALIRDIKAVVAPVEAVAAVTKNLIKTTKVTSRTKASPTKAATNPRAATNLEGDTRTNTTIGTGAAGADTGGGVDTNKHHPVCSL